MSTPEAHLELTLMSSRVAGLFEEAFFDRFRRRHLTDSDVLTAIGALISETRVCGGSSVAFGKVIVNEILEFLERDPEFPSGLQLECSLKSLSRMVPSLAPKLAPISIVVESKSFGKLYQATRFTEDLQRRADIFFNPLADILNLTRDMILGDDSRQLPGFEEPTPFDLDLSENPFDLEDEIDVNPVHSGIVKFLIRLSLAEGDLHDAEQRFISSATDKLGEALSRSQMDRMVSEASTESMEQILGVFEHQSAVFKEKLLMAGMLLTASDGRVKSLEKKLLVQAATWLGISRSRYSEIGTEAIRLIKQGSPALGERLTESGKHAGKLLSASLSAPGSQRNGRMLQIPDVQERPVSEIAPATGSLQIASDSNPVKARPEPDRSSPRTRPTISETPPAVKPKPAKMWWCPACNLPQFFQFDECPQCGIIVSKYRGAASRQVNDLSEEMIEIPPAEPSEEEVVPEPVPASHGTPPGRCTACHHPLLETSKFCPMCGTKVCSSDSP
ncbi:zinc ribbon domain-containing protein [Desulfomonile tiedjei]|nr:zinc ribbon domain-containing protein [Desulfomonile tiedjei]